MKILVPMKQVVDPDQSRRLSVEQDASGLVRSGLDVIANPFDEYALESALRLTEAHPHAKVRMGDVAVATLGTIATESMLRAALALGASTATRIDADDETLDAALAARALVRLCEMEAPDLVVMGKQTVDGDGHEVPERTATLLGWPLVACASAMTRQADGTLRVEREIDGGIIELTLELPAIVSVDLRIVAPRAVRSNPTSPVSYPNGLRYATLPAIIAAKRKLISVYPLDALLSHREVLLRQCDYSMAPTRGACIRLASVEELVLRLARDSRLS